MQRTSCEISHRALEKFELSDRNVKSIDLNRLHSSCTPALLIQIDNPLLPPFVNNHVKKDLINLVIQYILPSSS